MDCICDEKLSCSLMVAVKHTPHVHMNFLSVTPSHIGKRLPTLQHVFVPR